ncbi:MAG: type II toxin-antitoxin system HicA family toxin [Dehalococcoidia bacterium]
MRYRELTRRLQRLGIEFRRQASGSHEIWWNPEKKLYTIVPRHPTKEIKKGTVAKIAKDLGLTMEDIQRA